MAEILRHMRDGKVINPEPIKDGLVLWYDFAGMRNTDADRGIAYDWSGNGNHGTLQNFNFTENSGYDSSKNKLLFDGVDDYVGLTNPLTEQTPESQQWSVEFLISIKQSGISTLLLNWNRGLQSRGRGEQLTLLNYTENDDYLYNTHRFDVGETIHVVFSYDYTSKEIGITLNGDNRDTTVMESHPAGIGSDVRIINRMAADLHSFKIYNRPLTPSEIAHNYAIEKERFGIE